MAASPVSPQAATEAAILAMRSEPILSGGIHAREAQTHGTDRQTAQVVAQTDSSVLLPLPTETSKNMDFEPVPVIEASTAVDTTVRGFDSATLAPVIIPPPTDMAATVSQAATHEPEHFQPPRVEPTAVERSMLPPSSSFQQAGLPVMTPSQPPPAILRPVGAFSYTAPAAPTGVPCPPSTDRYIPAIGFSPSRARVARNPPADPPADPLLGRVRVQAYTADPLPAVPQQNPLPSTRGVAATVGVQEASTIPAVSTGTMLATPVDLSRTETQSTGAVYGPGVTSTLASGTPLSSHPAPSSPSQGLTQTAPPAATIVAGPFPVGSPAGQFGNPTEQLGNPTRQLGASPVDAGQLLTPPEAAGVPFGPPHMAAGLQAATFSPHVATEGPLLVPTGPTLSPTALAQGVGLPVTSAETIGIVASVTPVPATPSGSVFVAPDATNLVSPLGGSTMGVPGALAAGPQGTAPGPLQAGQTMAPGPVAEGTELQASDLDAWADADSAMEEEEEPLSQAGLRSESGPVCEGIETDSDVWSDSAASEPGTPISSSQAVVSASSFFWGGGGGSYPLICEAHM